MLYSASILLSRDILEKWDKQVRKKKLEKLYKILSAKGCIPSEKQIQQQNETYNMLADELMEALLTFANVSIVRLFHNTSP